MPASCRHPTSSLIIDDVTTPTGGLPSNQDTGTIAHPLPSKHHHARRHAAFCGYTFTCIYIHAWQMHYITHMLYVCTTCIHYMHIRTYMTAQQDEHAQHVHLYAQTCTYYTHMLHITCTYMQHHVRMHTHHGYKTESIYVCKTHILYIDAYTEWGCGTPQLNSVIMETAKVLRCPHFRGELIHDGIALEAFQGGVHIEGSHCTVCPDSAWTIILWVSRSYSGFLELTRIAYTYSVYICARLQ